MIHLKRLFKGLFWVFLIVFSTLGVYHTVPGEYVEYIHIVGSFILVTAVTSDGVHTFAMASVAILVFAYMLAWVAEGKEREFWE